MMMMMMMMFWCFATEDWLNFNVVETDIHIDLLAANAY